MEVARIILGTYALIPVLLINLIGDLSWILMQAIKMKQYGIYPNSMNVFEPTLTYN